VNTLTLPAGCPVTLAIIAVAGLAFLGQGATGDGLTAAGLLYGPAVADGQWWRLVTSAFLHGDLLHVGLNLFMLYALGAPLERGIGSVRFTLIAIGALLGGALAVVTFDWRQQTLGASSVVMGVAAAYAVALHARGEDPRRHPTFGLVILNLAIPLLVPIISFWGHLGGAIGGALLTWIVVWRPSRVRSNPARDAAGGAMSVASPGIAALVLLAAGAVVVSRLGGIG